MSGEQTQTKIVEGELKVSDIMTRQPLTVPLGTPLLRVAKILRASQTQHVLVTDGDGKVVGVVSANDIVDQLARQDIVDGPDLDDQTVESVMTTKFIACSTETHAQELTAVMADGTIQCMPIFEGNRLVGVMTPKDILLSWNRLHPTLQQAGNDALTGLANRATFDRRLAEEVARAHRRKIALGLMFVDVDNFKQINDTCGHLTGDAVLRMIGVSMKRHLREYDVICRFGGDEFAAICCDFKSDDMLGPVHRIQEAIKSVSVPSTEGWRAVTISIGTALLPDGAEEITPACLIHAADECLYQAKRDGRGRSRSVELTGYVNQAQDVVGQGLIDVLISH